MRRITTGLLLSAILASAAAAQPATEVRDVAAKPTRVVLFKNGLGLVENQVDLPAGDGRFRVTSLPDATMGMFWLGAPQGTTLSDIRATQVMAVDKTATSIAEMLEANIGKTVSIRLAGAAGPGVENWKQIKIRDIPREEASRTPEYDRFTGQLVLPSSIPTPIRSQMLLYEDGDNLAALPISNVLEVRLPKDAGVKVERAHKAMEFNAKHGAGEARVSVTTLAQGIAWLPSYVIDIADEKKATITAKAIIINDLAPLENVQAELVAGFPNIEFSGIPDAFTLTPLTQLMERIRARPSASGAGMDFNNMMTQQFDGYSSRQAGAGALPAGPVMGEASEDLYFYPVKSLTLKKGERSYNDLFVSSVEYEHIYTWEVPDFINEENGYSSERGKKPPPQVVWHALKVTNKSGLPWTTGPASTVKAGRVLGQSMLSFTPNNATAEVRITQVASISAEQSETEAERKRNAARFYGSDYDLVTVKGELQLSNYLDKPMTVKITKTLSGEVVATEGKSTVTKLARGLRKVNPQSQVVWNVEVPSGKDNAVCVKYTYQVYVRN